MANDATRRHLEWVMGTIAVLAVVGTAIGHRLSVVMEDVSFVVVVLMEILFLGLGWWRLVRGWRNEAARWRIWIGLVGCVLFSLAFVTPLIPMFYFFMRWQPRYPDFRTMWLGLSVATVLAGIVSRTVRFPLIGGVLMMAALVFMIPVAVL